MKAFFDSSSFAKRYLDEPGTDEVAEICQGASELAVSSICLPEIISALCRLKHNGRMHVTQYKKARQALLDDLHDVTVCNITMSVIQRSIELLEKNTLRAMDALHIGCALEWQAQMFVTSDASQLAAAKKAGLQTVFV